MLTTSPPPIEVAADLGSVGVTRGFGCSRLAALLGDRPPVTIDGDLRHSCIAHHIELLVARKATSFDLVPTVVPRDVDLDRVTAVTAAVGDGPHSPLAAAVASRLGWGPGRVVAAAADPRPRAPAPQRGPRRSHRRA